MGVVRGYQGTCCRPTRGPKRPLEAMVEHQFKLLTDRIAALELSYEQQTQALQS